MRMNALWGSIVTVLLPATAFYFTALPSPSFAQQESSFFLQAHGDVRVLRGVSEGMNFEPAVIVLEDEETEEESAQQEASVQPTAPVVTPQRGIVTHRAGRNTRVRERLGGRTPSISGNRMRIHRAGESSRGNISVHRMGRSDQSNIRTHRAGG